MNWRPPCTNPVAKPTKQTNKIAESCFMVPGTYAGVRAIHPTWELAPWKSTGAEQHFKLREYTQVEVQASHLGDPDWWTAVPFPKSSLWYFERKWPP